MDYSGVFIFGDSLVDAGNALKLAEFADDISLADLPEGIPTSDEGYHDGRFTDGLTFADLVSNKFISVPTTTVFPFGFTDPWIGISFQFVSDPDGNNLNFAYGGAQIRKGEEVVPDLDDQTDAFIDAVDGEADPNALHMVTMGGNDVRRLVPDDGVVVDSATARSILVDAAQEMHEELRDLIQAGVRHLVVSGIPDVGMIPEYNGLLDEGARRTAATEYSAILDGMTQDYLGQLRAEYPQVKIDYVSLAEASAEVIGKLDQIYSPEALAPLHNPSDILFFDRVHPTAQAHALLAATYLDSINGSSSGEAVFLKAPDQVVNGVIAASGEVDRIVLSLAADTSYTFEMLGSSSGFGTLADPLLHIVGPGGTMLAGDDDGGLGLDASFRFSTTQAGEYAFELTGVGGLSGTYSFQYAAQPVTDGNAPAIFVGGIANDVFTGGVGDDQASGHGGDDTLDGGDGDDTLKGGPGNDMLIGGAGSDTASYADASASVDVWLTKRVAQDTLGAGIDTLAGIENLIGSEFADTLVGSAVDNRLEGHSGDDRLYGGDGADILSGEGGNDLLIAGQGIDTMIGGLGDDIYEVRQAEDVVTEAVDEGVDMVRAYVDYTMAGHTERMYMYAPPGVGLIGTGNEFDNLILGTGSGDTLSGMGGSDQLRGNGGIDTLNGDDGNDYLWGGLGGDILDGGADSDILRGDVGADQLRGGDGSDMLWGGLLRDTLTGGLGSDLFVFDDGDSSGLRTHADQILDFSHAEGDRLHLRQIDADENLAGDQNFSFIGTRAFTGTAGQLQYSRTNGFTFVEGDVNGDLAADFSIRLYGLHVLVGSDLVL